MGLRYDFEFSWGSTYGHAIRLVQRNSAPGLVVDLGAGVGVPAAPLADLGYDYHGFDADRDAIAAAAERGVRIDPIDLEDRSDAAERIVSGVAGRRVAAVMMLDTIEHLVDPDAVTTWLAELLDRLGTEEHRPVLVVSIPNVAHEELGAKLVMGRWDVTDAGLLDATHITLFDAARLDALMPRHGLEELERDDLGFAETEQHFPVGHPAIEQATPLSRFLRELRRRSDAHAMTYQFIRCYRRTSRHATAVGNDAGNVVAAPWGTVVVRTQGRRESLDDALVCLSAQTDDDLEILVMVHRDDDEAVDRVRDVVGRYPDSFNRRVRVVPVHGGGRSRPLNRALELATGSYWMVLDDDDVVTADWVEAFRRGAERAPGTIVRARCALQVQERRDHGIAESERVTGFELPYPERFDLFEHVGDNRTPICSFAAPLAAIRAIGLGFDEDLTVYEDWKFLVHLANLTGVTDVPEVTSVYRIWSDDSGAAGSVPSRQWDEDRAAVRRSFDASTFLLAPGEAGRVASVMEGAGEIGALQADRSALHETRAALEHLRREHDALQHRLDALERSRFWRITSPLRRLTAMRGRLAVRLGRSANADGG